MLREWVAVSAAATRRTRKFRKAIEKAADDFGISQRHARRLVTAHRRHVMEEERRAEEEAELLTEEQELLALEPDLLEKFRIP